MEGGSFVGVGNACPQQRKIPEEILAGDTFITWEREYGDVRLSGIIWKLANIVDSDIVNCAAR